MKESWKFDVNEHLENLKKTNERMGKLKSLLKEYNNIITCWDTLIEPRVTLDNLTSWWWCFNLEWHLVLISKEYWFIDWLCDSGRIDIGKSEKHYYWLSLAEELVMRLSISENPISDLIYYLK